MIFTVTRCDGADDVIGLARTSGPGVGADAACGSAGPAASVHAVAKAATMRRRTNMRAASLHSLTDPVARSRSHAQRNSFAGVHARDEIRGGLRIRCVRAEYINARLDDPRSGQNRIDQRLVVDDSSFRQIGLA